MKVKIDVIPTFKGQKKDCRIFEAESFQDAAIAVLGEYIEGEFTVMNLDGNSKPGYFHAYKRTKKKPHSRYGVGPMVYVSIDDGLGF